jgi:GntP family gluconate:H+ symporter
MGLLILLLVAVLFVVLSTAKLRLHPFLALLFAAIGFGILSGRPLPEVVESVRTGFGGTIGYIGIVIVAGTIIGEFLERSGGAFAIAERALRVTGERQVPLAMSIVGFIVSIPVFCDSGFVILSPLNKGLSKKAGISLAGSAIALSLGLYASHTMVPPTPGPIAAAGILNVDVGQVILWGILVSIPTVFVGWLFAIRVASRTWIEPVPEVTEREMEERIRTAPGASFALAPILIPIVLILLKSVADLPASPVGEGLAADIVRFVGDPVVALLIGVLISLGLPEKLERQMLSTTGWVGEGLAKGAVIILITGAGGAFGRVLQDSGIAERLGTELGGLNLGIWLPFLLAAAIKTAQGSSTVAIITTASIMVPLLAPLGLEAPVARTLTVLAIGAGSMVVSHANDSYFWVVTQFSGMDTNTGYRLQTLGTLVQGFAAGLVIWALGLVLF